MMASKNGHWVEDLFPPTFQYSAENFNLKDEKHGSLNSQQNRVLLTAENIQNIYQRVSSLAVAEANNVAVQEQTEESKQVLSDMTPERDPPKSPDPEDIIWTAEELSIFRKEFCSLKKENLQLCVKVQELEKYSKHLEETLRNSLKGMDSLKDKLDVMKKANKRQSIQNDILKSELKTATSAIEMLHQMNTSLSEERDILSKKSSEQQIQINKERIENMRLNEHLESTKSDFTKQLISEKEKLQNIYESRIQSLINELDATVKNYEEEREEHTNTKHAHQELLRHFSSLTGTNSSVKNDQILALK